MVTIDCQFEPMERPDFDGNFRCKCGVCGRETLSSKWPPEKRHATCRAFDSWKQGQEPGLKSPPEPSIPYKALNFTREVLAGRIGMTPTCTQDEIDGRLSLCRECKYYDTRGVCTHKKCGCAINNQLKFLNKLAHKAQACPIGKW